MQKILLAVLGASLLIGLAISDDSQYIPLKSVSKDMIFNYEDTTNGMGNFASYGKIVEQGQHSDARILDKLATISLQRMDHGSGSIEREMTIGSVYAAKYTVSPDYNYNYSLINALISNSMVYSPQTIPIGTGYYAVQPVRFNSLLSDMTQIKNHASGTSMDHETTYAKAIQEDLAAGVEDDYYTAEWLPSAAFAKTQMNIEESVISGTAHIGMLQGRNAFEYSKSALYKPDIDIDETYTGTFSFATKLNWTKSKSNYESSDEWLPCCSDGWDLMNYYDKKGFGASTKGLFDCTCPKVFVKAQFPEEA